MPSPRRSPDPGWRRGPCVCRFCGITAGRAVLLPWRQLARSGPPFLSPLPPPMSLAEAADPPCGTGVSRRAQPDVVGGRNGQTFPHRRARCLHGTARGLLSAWTPRMVSRADPGAARPPRDAHRFAPRPFASASAPSAPCPRWLGVRARRRPVRQNGGALSRAFSAKCLSDRACSIRRQIAGHRDGPGAGARPARAAGTRGAVPRPAKGASLSASRFGREAVAGTAGPSRRASPATPVLAARAPSPGIARAGAPTAELSRARATPLGRAGRPQPPARTTPPCRVPQGTPRSRRSGRVACATGDCGCRPNSARTAVSGPRDPTGAAAASRRRTRAQQAVAGASGPAYRSEVTPARGAVWAKAPRWNDATLQGARFRQGWPGRRAKRTRGRRGGTWGERQRARRKA